MAGRRVSFSPPYKLYFMPEQAEKLISFVLRVNKIMAELALRTA